MRKLLAFVFAFTLLCSQVVFAMPATPGNADYDNEFFDNKISVDGVTSSTVDLTNVSVSLRYYDMNNVLHEVQNQNLSKDGYFSFSRPSDFASAYDVAFYFQDVLPPSAKYNIRFSFGSNTGGFSYSDCYFYSNYFINNAEMKENTIPITIQQNSGDFSGGFNLDIGKVRNTVLSIRFKNGYLPFPYGGYFNLYFRQLSSSAPVDNQTAGGSYGSGDAANDTASNTGQIADNTSQLVDGQNQIVQSLKDIVQTISYQLEAFWLQLAHEFTNLYNKMNEQHAEIMQAIQDGFNVTINNQFDELIENDNKNHQEQIRNDNQNTDKITNGYDNSSLNQSNQNLSDALNEYQSKEDELLGQTTDKIENFQFDNPFTKFIAPLQDVAYMLNGIYISLGSFNIPIGFSLTLTIALLCIGWYRFRGGG